MAWGSTSGHLAQQPVLLASLPHLHVGLQVTTLPIKAKEGPCLQQLMAKVPEKLPLYCAKIKKTDESSLQG